MILYPLIASLPTPEFETEGHILVTLAMIFHVVLDVSREESSSNMVLQSINNDRNYCE